MKTRRSFENNLLNKNISSTQKKSSLQKYIPPKLQVKSIQKKNKSFAEKKIKKNSLPVINSKTKHKKEVNFTTLNIEDSSTNCFSGNNLKNNCTKKNTKEELFDSKIEFNMPFLLPTVTEAESVFINTKLAENDSLDVSPIKISNEKTILQKSNKDDSCELYDFNDEKQVNLVLKNFSMLSHSQSNKDKSSTILEDCNDEETSGNKKVINKVKIFNTKHSKENFMKVATLNFNEF